MAEESQDAGSASEMLESLIQRYASDGTINFDDDSSNDIFEAVARHANNKKPLPSTPEEVEKYLDSMPLFATQMPQPGEESDAFKAIQAVIDNTPVEKRMYNYKESGNRAYNLALRMNAPRPDETPADRARRLAAQKTKYLEASAFYSHAIEVARADGGRVLAEEPTLTASVYLNRAACNLPLENYGKVVQDARQVLAIQPGNVKALWRAATALFRLKKYQAAFVLCRQGLISPLLTDKKGAEAEALMKLARTVCIDWKKQEDALAAIAARKRAEAAAKKAKDDAMAAALQIRGLTVGSAQFLDTSAHYGSHEARVDAEGAMQWPVVFLYPDAGQSDFVPDFDDRNTLDALLGMMFPPKAQPPAWDTAREYVCGRLDVTVTVGAAESFAEDRARVDADKGTVLTVDTSLTLGEALAVLCQRGYVIPAFPTFCVRPKGAKPLAGKAAATKAK